MGKECRARRGRLPTAWEAPALFASYLRLRLFFFGTFGEGSRVRTRDIVRAAMMSCDALLNDSCTGWNARASGMAHFARSLLLMHSILLMHSMPEVVQDRNCGESAQRE